MVEIIYPEQLNTWLNGRPPEWGQVMAMRVAMRVIPSLRSPQQRERLTLAVFRSVFISWAARRYPTQNMRSAAAVDAVADANRSAYAAYADAATAARRVYAAIARAAYAAYGAVEGAAAFTTTAAAAAAEAAADAAAHTASADVADAAAYEVWSSIEADAEWLIGQPEGAPHDHARNLALKALWLEGMPGFARRSWNKFQKTLAKSPWATWGDWYARRLADAPSGFGLPDDIEERLVVGLAQEADAFWNRDPDIVNEEITKRVAAARFEAATGQLPEIPSVRPASLEPEWENGVLIVPDRAIYHDPGADLPQALQALKDDLREFSGDLVGVNEVGRHVSIFLGRLGERVPLAEPSQYELHRIGVAEAALAEFVKTTEFSEWPDLLASRLLGIQLQFDRLLGQFPSWRQFKRNAEQEAVEPEEIERVAEISERLATVFETDAGGLVSPAVAEALHLQADTLYGDNGLTHSKIMEAIDAREGVRNTFKRIASQALQEFSDGLSAEAKKIPRRAGKGAVQLFVLACKAVAGVYVPVALGMPMTEVLAFYQANPWVVLMIAGGDGWLKRTLEVFAKSKVEA